MKQCLSVGMTKNGGKIMKTKWLKKLLSVGLCALMAGGAAAVSPVLGGVDPIAPRVNAEDLSNVSITDITDDYYFGENSDGTLCVIKYRGTLPKLPLIPITKGRRSPQ